MYRPFVAMHCYAEDRLVKRPGIRNAMFPEANTDNRVICVPGVGSTKPFSALMVDAMPDLHFVAFGQCFPRYRFERIDQAKEGSLLEGQVEEIRRLDNVTDFALDRFQRHYQNPNISKDDIYNMRNYVYGVLHARDFRSVYPNALSKELARIPMAGDFKAFAGAGRELGSLHVGYENCPEFPLELVFSGTGDPQPEHFRLGPKKMRYGVSEGESDRFVLIVNEHLTLRGIPDEAQSYVVNGRTPLDWLIDRYTVSVDKKSGILNDANEWFERPEDLISAIRRIVHLSVETTRIIENLPESLVK